MKKPLVTVLMPVYNAELHLSEAIQSVLNQSFSEFHLLIINDGSTDGSLTIIKDFDDERIELLNLSKNGGLVNALNSGLARIDTKYIARADADDICLPQRLRLQLEFMENHPEVGALGTGFDSLLPNDEVKKGGRFSPDHRTIRLRHLYQIQIIHGTSMLRTDVLKKHRLVFDPDFKHAEDYDFFDRLGNVAQIANLQESHYYIRHHEARVSSQFSEIQKTNSNRVKIRILGQIGIIANLEDLDLIQWLMYQNYAWFDIDRCRNAVKLINKLINANNQTQYFDAEYFRSQLCSRFLHLCNAKAMSDPKVVSLLSQLEHLKFSDGPRLILFSKLKSLIN